MSDAARPKRRRRGRRGGARREQAAVAPTAERTPTSVSEWDWRTFPVFFAFVVGMLVMGMLIWIAPGAFYIFLVTAVFLSIFGVMHIFGRSLRDYRDAEEDEG